MKRAKLVAVPISYDFTTLGCSVTTHNGKQYDITITDRKKRMYKLKLYKIDDICGEMGSIRRSSGKIKMLIGMKYAPLHPVAISGNEGLVFYKSLFGTEKILGGTYLKT